MLHYAIPSPLSDVDTLDLVFYLVPQAPKIKAEVICQSPHITEILARKENNQQLDLHHKMLFLFLRAKYCHIKMNK